MDSLIVTCDGIPLPPLNGHSRKAHDVLMAMAPRVETHVIAYVSSPAEGSALQDYWSSKGAAVRLLTRRTAGRHLRAARQGLSLPTVTRDFLGETEAVREISSGADARLLIDFLSGAPLVREFRSGVVLSGHDCLSLLFLEEARNARSLPTRLRFLLRRQLALRAERQFAHLPERFHVVSERDACAIRAVNPETRPCVIPIGGKLPDIGELASPELRSLDLVWGNLESAVIASGLAELLEVVGRSHPAILRNWTVVGRIPAAQAMSRFPLLPSLGLRYVARLEDLGPGNALGRTSRLLLPDLGGTGQKNRTMDGMAFGCCVLGLDEVFRGLDSPAPEAFVRAADMETLVESLGKLERSQATAVGARARAFFADHFSSAFLERRWFDLLSSLSPLKASRRSGASGRAALTTGHSCPTSGSKGRGRWEIGKHAAGE